MNHKTRILIVDDSCTNRILLKAVLEDLDIEVLEAHSAIKALSMLQTVTPDIILLDMCMPLMDGLDFLENLQPSKKKIPVIVVSVLDDQVQMQKAFRLGAADYLIKPIEPDELITRIARYTNSEVII